jgi:hypothetical protein
MLKGIHFLLTYKCNRSCEHCFVYAGPQARGTFTLEQIRRVFDEIQRIGTIEGIFFEGGEPFLFYPIMLEGVRIARSLGLRAGVVTNAYWATSPEDAAFWLRPLAELGLAGPVLSDDLFHHAEDEADPAECALGAARKLGMTPTTICTQYPKVETGQDGKPTVTGGVMFRGRAAEELLTDEMPTQPWTCFTACTAENLRDPARVHVDAYGNVHLCQGLLMGNMWQTPLSELVAGYDPDAHPVVGPLLRGGPAELARSSGIEHEEEYVSACHLCYAARRALVDRFPCQLGPRQVYGLE